VCMSHNTEKRNVLATTLYMYRINMIHVASGTADHLLVQPIMLIRIGCNIDHHLLKEPDRLESSR